MNPCLKYAFELGREKACYDLGLTKEAGPMWEGVKRVGKKLLQPKWALGLGMPLAGAGIGALASEDKLKGALMGGLGGLGLYGGLRASGVMGRSPALHGETQRILAGLHPEEARAVVEDAAGRGSRRILGGVLGASGLGAGMALGSQIAPEQQGKPGLFSLTPERAEGLKQLIPMAAQLLPAMMQGQGGAAGLLPDLGGAASPEMMSMQQPEMSYAMPPEMSYPGGYPQGMM